MYAGVPTAIPVAVNPPDVTAVSMARATPKSVTMAYSPPPSCPDSVSRMFSA
jgi:hypothetical protein